MPLFNPASSGAVTSVTAGDTSVVVGGTSAAPTVATGTLDVIAADHPPAAAWSNNSKKITSLANGSGAQDAAAFGQVPTTASQVGALPSTDDLSAIATANATAASVAMNSHKITGLANGSAGSDAAAFGQIPLADTTAAHILGDGAQAAGANGAWADSGHVHPYYGWIPSDNGLLTSNLGDPAECWSTSATIAGTVYLMKLPIRTAITISNLWFVVTSPGSGTSTTSFCGLYGSSGSLLTGSSDISTPLKTSSLAQCPLTTPQALSAGTFVWAALLTNLSSTQPTLGKGIGVTTGITSAGLTAATYRWATCATSVSALPSPSITPSSNVQTNAFSWWVGAS